MAERTGRCVKQYRGTIVGRSTNRNVARYYSLGISVADPDQVFLGHAKSPYNFVFLIMKYCLKSVLEIFLFNI